MRRGIKSIELVEEFVESDNSTKNNNPANNNHMEETIKNLIRKSLKKRIIGHGNIDNVVPNQDLIEHWVTAIMAIAYNEDNIEAAAQDINDIQAQILPSASMEDTRAFVFLAQYRFGEEIAAFEKYVELRYRESDDAILYAVKEELSYVEPGSFVTLD